nr:hypothetical protein [Tanacetum cinerariifolium]
MAEKFNQEKEKNEKLKELKSRLNFEGCSGTSWYSESKTMSTKEHGKRHRSRRSCSPRTSVFSRIRRERSRSPWYMEALSESEDSGGGHWKSRSKKKKSSGEEDDLSQPWQKKYIKERIEFHNIKQRDGESTEDFVRSYKLESRDVKGRQIDEMIRETTSFLRGEVAASNHERKKSFPPWKQHEGNEKQNFIK